MVPLRQPAQFLLWLPPLCDGDGANGECGASGFGVRVTRKQTDWTLEGQPTISRTTTSDLWLPIHETLSGYSCRRHPWYMYQQSSTDQLPNRAHSAVNHGRNLEREIHLHLEGSAGRACCCCRDLKTW
eukprot:COSAG01_NODE_27313_length_689_cov_0.640678_1_plen_127_part_10